jgi:hypothetical protein
MYEIPDTCEFCKAEGSIVQTGITWICTACNCMGGNLAEEQGYPFDGMGGYHDRPSKGADRDLETLEDELWEWLSDLDKPD